MTAKPVVKVSDSVNTLPTLAGCAAPVSVSLAVLATAAKLVKPVAATETASFNVALTHVLRSVTVGFLVFVNVQIAVLFSPSKFASIVLVALLTVTNGAGVTPSGLKHLISAPDSQPAARLSVIEMVLVVAANGMETSCD